MNTLNGVEDTLFIPLVGRIYSSKNYKEFFYDAKALELEQYIPTKLIEENTDEYFTIASIARFYEFDNLVKKFIFRNGECNIICLGCGLETMYYRVNDEKATFYEVDFPDVIDQRKIALGESEHEILIGCNVLDYTWMDKVDKTKPTLVIASGIFQYLHREDVVGLIKEFGKQFTRIELAFDATNKTGLKKANDYVKKTGNTNAMMYFYVNKVDDLLKDTETKLIGIVPFFQTSSKALKNKLSMRTKFMCFFGDRLGYSRIIYLNIK